MNRISKAFSDKKAFIAFVTGGDPNIETTEKLIVALAESGVDIIEIGIPFSDPAAEGPVIEAASGRALANGTTVDKLFAMVKRVRETVKIPLLLMTYINPIFAYGTDKFMRNCQDCGIDGVIVPDLPFEERGEIADACKSHGITSISLIAPTSRERIEAIAREADGFLYCVSSMGVTGVRKNIETDLSQTIAQVKAVSDVPCAIGFGIATPEQAKEMAAISDGVIIGSAIVEIIAEHGENCIDAVRKYVQSVRAAV